MLTRRRLLPLLILLAGIAPTGCADLERDRANSARAQAAHGRADDEEHAELERELSLYSD